MHRILEILPLLLVAPASANPLSFQRDVRPLLSDKCFACHGPDVESNKADLRLDLPDAAFGKLKDSAGHAIVPGDAAASVAWQRVSSMDPDEVMPPPESNLTLSQEEKDILRRWIEEGAEYEPHWAFQLLPESVARPAARSEWSRQPFDDFVLTFLDERDISPSPPASAARWLRRASFDTTGLPPEILEIAEFEKAFADDPEAAKVNAVDRLLASPAYGEHMAVAWLDAARYADSYGYQSDQLNNQWPWRDWVVRAFNDNLPYDRFVTWQLAGDLLESPTRDQILATAFNRLHRLTNEGGSIREEWLAENAADRVHTFGTAILGLTLECARCHDHKYDPISARDYYSLAAFFSAIDENGLYDHAAKTPSPSLLLPDDEQEKQLETARRNLATAEENDSKTRREAEARFAAWQSTGPELAPVPPFVAARFEEEAEPGVNRNGLPLVDSPGGKTVRLDGDHGIVFPDAGIIDRWTPFTMDLRLKPGETDTGVVVQKTYGTDVGYNGFDLMLDHGHLEARLYRVWPGNAVGIRTKEPVARGGEWLAIALNYDGSSSASGLTLSIDGGKVPVEILRDGLVKTASLPTYGNGQLTIGARFRDRGLPGAEIEEFLFHNENLPPALFRDNHPWTVDEARAYFLTRVDGPAREAFSALTTARESLARTEEGIAEIPVMRDSPAPRPTHLLARGRYDAPTSEETLVQPDTFKSILPPFGDLPRNRLGLAQWATRPDHPLTARVFVNRLWANFFGKGLVATPENFGLQGALPENPALLDWLARDFVDHGWDIKRLCRQILLSATYGQDSRLHPDLAERDPGNAWLARGPARRLSAEEIRDLALAASGLLDRHPGGPPVSPYQPGADLWRESNGMSPPYQQSTGRALHRRSLYSVWKRTAPLPNMAAFDAPSREVCSVYRANTNTPLQALVLLNDVQFVEAARQLASRLPLDEPGTFIPRFYQILTGVTPDARETAILKKLFASELARFHAEPDEAAKLLAFGETPPPPDADPPRLAAATTLCLAILNLDATIWKR